MVASERLFFELARGLGRTRHHRLVASLLATKIKRQNQLTLYEQTSSENLDSK